MTSLKSRSIMRKLISILVVTVSSIYANCDTNAQRLVNSYSSIAKCKDNHIYLKSGEKFLYDDSKRKSFNELLNNPDIEDMFFKSYPRGWVKSLPKNYDPGRVRYERLFRKIYGNSAQEVRRNLTTIRWVDGSLIKVTKKEGVASALSGVVKDLKKLPPKYKKFLAPIGGTFKWRTIAGTRRLSVHSFGAAIDISVKHSAYWRWSKGAYRYQNKIPKEIVDVFEKHGFIWGGKWYHYDTMHFEYRPELLR